MLPSRPEQFRDRDQAGRLLAAHLVARGVEADAVVAVPRGGLEAGMAVADDLDLPLGVIVVETIGAPGNPELVIGATAPDGSAWVDANRLVRLGVDEAHLRAAQERAAQAARQVAERYRECADDVRLDGQRVIVVDDGVETGSTARIAIQAARSQGARQVVLAVPVGPPGAIEELRAEADRLLCLRTPPELLSVSQFYRVFPKLGDGDALSMLEDRGGDVPREEP